MRFVRPFDVAALQSGDVSDWLIGPLDDAGVTIRIRRGGGQAQQSPQPSSSERLALVLEGQVVLYSGRQEHTAACGELVFVPAGQVGAVTGSADAVWAEIEAPLPEDAVSGAASDGGEARVIQIDPDKFLGGGFAYQALIDRSLGSQTMRMNVLQVAPGAGSPDFHIHAFAQIYLIQEGEMTLDIGLQRVRAGKNSVVLLPAGLVHRNFNASQALERHVSLLVPEPQVGEVFDYAVTIADVEAQLLENLPE